MFRRNQIQKFGGFSIGLTNIKTLFISIEIMMILVHIWFPELDYSLVN